MPDTAVPTVQESAFDEATQLAYQALEHARRHRSPPLPQAYEVWFAYVRGEDRELCARIDRELSRTAVVDLEKIDEIYQEHFRDSRLSTGIAEIGDGLDTGLMEAIEALRDGLGSSQRFLGSLKDARDRISQSSGLPPRPEATGSVTELIELAQAHAARTESLTGELARVRKQVKELQGELQLLRDTAYLDHLTQIANRRHMEEVMEREIDHARAANESLCFALGDLDHFKALNDTHGHAVGDAALKHVAALIKRNIKGQDTPARFGGEEFAIIFPNTSLINATTVMDNIRQQLCGSNLVLSRGARPIGRISASFGVTRLLPDDTAETLIQRTDGLLYRAKQLGRNRVVMDG